MPGPMRHAKIAAVLALLATILPAQTATRAETRSSVPSPAEVLGRPLGETYSRHCEVVDYARRVAATSPRVRLKTYGRTSEGRELMVLVVTSPENHARAADLEARYAKVADPRKLAPGEDVKKILEDLPVVVWLSYNVHGNEASPSECALAVLHRLASADDAETKRWLSEAIVVIDPCLNPDGRDRYVNWFKGEVGRRPDPDPDSREHDEPWPGGRTNHFQFDLNRDWAFASQVETRGRLPLFVALTPQVHVDFHEMSAESTYFFFPAEKPINSNFPPHTVKWGKVFGQGNAAAFDKQGLPYYTSRGLRPLLPRLRRLVALARGRDRHDLRDGGQLRVRRVVPAPRRHDAHARDAAQAPRARELRDAEHRRVEADRSPRRLPRISQDGDRRGAGRRDARVPDPGQRGPDARRRARARAPPPGNRGGPDEGGVHGAEGDRHLRQGPARPRVRGGHVGGSARPAAQAPREDAARAESGDPGAVLLRRLGLEPSARLRRAVLRGRPAAPGRARARRRRRAAAGRRRGRRLHGRMAARRLESRLAVRARGRAP